MASQRAQHRQSHRRSGGRPRLDSHVALRHHAEAGSESSGIQESLQKSGIRSAGMAITAGLVAATLSNPLRSSFSVLQNKYNLETVVIIAMLRVRTPSDFVRCMMRPGTKSEAPQWKGGQSPKQLGLRQFFTITFGPTLPSVNQKLCHFRHQ